MLISFNLSESPVTATELGSLGRDARLPPWMMQGEEKLSTGK